MNLNNTEWLIVSNALKKYSGPKKDITIPEGVEELHMNALENKKLDSIVFPTSLKTIYNNACSLNNLTTLNLPTGLEWLYSDAFSSNKLVQVNLPSTLKVISDSAFSNNNISSIYIPDSVLEIGGYAFSGNPLKRIIIGANTRLLHSALPNSITEIYIHNINHLVPAFINELLTKTNVFGNRELKITIFGPKLTFFEKRKITKILEGWNIPIIEDSSFDPTTLIDDVPQNDELNLLKSQIFTIISTLNYEERTAIENLVATLFNEYEEELNKIDTKPTLEDSAITLSLGHNSPKILKANLITNLETIINKLKTNTKYQSLLNKILTYENYFETKDFNEEDLSSDKIKFIIATSNKYKNSSLLNSLKELLNSTKKEISSYILITAFNSEIKLSLTKDIEQDFLYEVDCLYEKSKHLIKIKEFTSGNSSHETSRLIKLILEILAELDPKNQKLYHDEISIILNKYEQLLFDSKNIEIASVESNLKEELQPLITALNKYVVIYTGFKTTLNEISNAQNYLNQNIPNSGILIDIIKDLQELAKNEYIPSDIRNEITTKLKNLLKLENLLIWHQNILTRKNPENNLNSHKSSLNHEERIILNDPNLEMIILILKELYRLKFKLEQIIAFKQELSEVKNTK